MRRTSSRAAGCAARISALACSPFAGVRTAMITWAPAAREAFGGLLAGAAVRAGDDGEPAGLVGNGVHGVLLNKRPLVSCFPT